jgi:hypothetical protein
MDYKQFIKENFPRYEQDAMIGQIKMLRSIIKTGSVPTVEQEPISPLRAMFVSCGGNFHAVQLKLDSLELLALKYAANNFYNKLRKAQGLTPYPARKYN